MQPRGASTRQTLEDVVHFIWMLIIGLIAGALAKLIMPGRQGGGIIVTMLLGVAGAVIVGLLGRALGWYDASAGEGPGLIASTLGAIGVLAIYGFATKRNR
jgi:uncharacterized membrane protein YeaQ/YmgE (transglycosylase-associated protein family)